MPVGMGGTQLVLGCGGWQGVEEMYVGQNCNGGERDSLGLEG